QVLRNSDQRFEPRRCPSFATVGGHDSWLFVGSCERALLKAARAGLISDFVSVEYETEAFYLNGGSVFKFPVFKRRFERTLNFDVERFITQINIIFRKVSCARPPFGREHATDCLKEVRLARIIWSYDGADLRQVNREALEGPEVFDVERFQSHRSSPRQGMI